jgi:titin
VIITVAVAGALVPTFGTPAATADGFTVQITNFDAAYTWAGTATASGSVAINGTGLVTVTGVASSTSSTVTVTTTRTSYATGSATVTQTSAAVTCTTTSGGSIPTACALGTFGPGGGLVFLISAGRTYEMAPNNWNGTASDPTQVWTTNAATCYAVGELTIADQNCQTNNLYPGTAGEQAASSTASQPVGMGAANTTAIIARMNALTPTPVTTTDYAAGLARGYSPVVSGVTINDWFLPSQDELNAMCNYSRNPATPPTGTCTGTQDGTFAAGAFGFAADFYWSSSQNDAGTAGIQLFFNGSQGPDDKLNPRYVRPVRAF